MANDDKLKHPIPSISPDGMPKNIEAITDVPPVGPVVQVPVDKMQSILDRLDKQASEIAALNATVSQTRLAEARANVDADNRPRVHFNKVRGKVVIGWPESLGEDKKAELIYSPSNPSTPVGELLKCRFFFIDGTKSDLLDLVELTRSNDQVFARIAEDHGNTALLEFEDKSVASTPMEIHKKFFNA